MLVKISEKDFDLFINLWGNGGPNWMFEEIKYYKEKYKEWTLVSQKRNSQRTSVFKRINCLPRKVCPKGRFSRD
jgi:hypothetical protein